MPEKKKEMKASN